MNDNRFKQLKEKRIGKCSNCKEMKEITHALYAPLGRNMDKMWVFQGKIKKTIGYICDDCKKEFEYKPLMGTCPACGQEKDLRWTMYKDVDNKLIKHMFACKDCVVLEKI